MRMPRTIAEIMAQAEHLADRAESDDSPVGAWHDGAPMRALLAAFQKRAEAESEIAAAVEAARVEGYSWALIGGLIGTTGQSAREKYGTRRPVERLT